jgi:transposase-like protein
MRDSTKRILLEQGQNGAVRGEDHPGSKLTEEDVLDIVDAVKSGEYTKMAIARAFNISTTQVRQIMKGNSWSWLTGIHPKTTTTGKK